MTVVKVFITHEKVTGVIIFFTMNKSLFVEWLENQLSDKGWSPSELARRSGVSQSAISLVLSGERNPGNNFCDGIARAFKFPQNTVYEKAGILKIKPDVNARVKEAMHLYEQLKPDNQEDVYDIIKMKLEKQEKENAKHK